MPKSKAVSVLLAVYNASETLNQTLQSLSDQSTQDFIVVVVNDASTDDSGAVLARWQAQFGPDRFILITNQTNLGLTKSLNIGLSRISTPYTARLDADDWWDKEKLASQLAFMAQYPEHGVIGCNYFNIGANRQQPVKLPTTDPEIRRTMIRRNPFAHSCIMFHTELVRKLGGYDETIRYGQDYDLWWRCLPQTKFHNLPEFLCYRKTGRGISVSKQRAQMRQLIRTQVRYIKKYRLPATSYLSLLEPLLVIITPEPLKQWKRAIFD